MGLSDVRGDSFLLGVVVGVGLTIAATGLVQILITKGYMIAADLVDAGWTAR